MTHFTSPPHRNIYTVQQITEETKILLEASYPDIWIEGEISDLRSPSSGHRYFSLKDNRAAIRSVLFRSRGFQATCTPVDGMQILAQGRLSVYTARGDMQFIISYIEEAGEGALRRAFELLKRKLSTEGLFDEDRKRTLPSLPRRIGVVTSSHGAALHDVLVTLKRRYPPAAVLLYPVTVQGEQAAVEIAAALELASRRKEVDLLLLVRGGGSLQDLQAFNEESVARAVSACDLPVVSGVGHEIDFTIVDLVSDLRAPTPTGAAEAATPDVRELLEQLADFERRLARSAGARLATLQQRLDMGTSSLVHPRRRLKDRMREHRLLLRRLYLRTAAQLDLHGSQLRYTLASLRRHAPQQEIAKQRLYLLGLARRLQLGYRYLNRNRVLNLNALNGRLHALSPQHTLERGYAIVSADDGKRVIRKASEVAAGERVRTRLGHGELVCEVEDVLE